MKAAENLKEKLVVERQSKLLLEVKIRKEMAEAMFRQLLETEEAWRQVIFAVCFETERIPRVLMHTCVCIHIYVYVQNIPTHTI